MTANDGEVEHGGPEGYATDGRIGWVCDQGGFWGTTRQLCQCARCGKSEQKRHDQPRHYAGIFTPRMHMLCDACFDSLRAPTPTEVSHDPS